MKSEADRFSLCVGRRGGWRRHEVDDLGVRIGKMVS